MYVAVSRFLGSSRRTCAAQHYPTLGAHGMPDTGERNTLSQAIPALCRRFRPPITNLTQNTSLAYWAMIEKEGDQELRSWAPELLQPSSARQRVLQPGGKKGMGRGGLLDPCTVAIAFWSSSARLHPTGAVNLASCCHWAACDER